MGSRIDGGRPAAVNPVTLLPRARNGSSSARQGNGQRKAAARPAVNSAALAGRPFFALGKGSISAAVNPVTCCPGQGMEWQGADRQGSRIDGGGQLCPGQGNRQGQRKAAGQLCPGQGMEWRPVNPAAHCGRSTLPRERNGQGNGGGQSCCLCRRPFFALGKGSAAAGGGVLCPGQRKGKEWNSGRSIR